MKAGARPRALPDATISESRGVRYLHLGTPWIQGAMRLSDPLAIELEYVKRMMAWLLARDEDQWPATRLVQLGLGAGAIARFTVKRMRIATVVVELNPQVIAACRQWFRLPEGDLLEVVEAEAGAFVADPTRRGSADVLAVDLYDEEAASPVQDSVAFYRDCRDVLAPGGAMTVNLFGREAQYERTVERIEQVFGAAHVCTFKPTREGNAIVLAMKQVTLPARAELARRAENIETRWQLPARKWLRMMRPAPVDPAAPVPNLPPA